MDRTSIGEFHTDVIGVALFPWLEMRVLHSSIGNGS